jgi:hypothetical protein
VATDLPTLTRWCRQFIEVRDTAGAERCLASGIRAGHPPGAVADVLFAAATDHRSLDVGHVLDFTNKAVEALDWAGGDAAEVPLTSLLPNCTSGQRMEATNAWRHPVHLVAILEDALGQIPPALEPGRGSDWQIATAWPDLLPTLLGDDAQAISDGLLHALAHGARHSRKSWSIRPSGGWYSATAATSWAIGTQCITRSPLPTPCIRQGAAARRPHCSGACGTPR